MTDYIIPILTLGALTFLINKYLDRKYGTSPNKGMKDRIDSLYQDFSRDVGILEGGFNKFIATVELSQNKFITEQKKAIENSHNALSTLIADANRRIDGKTLDSMKQRKTEQVKGPI